MAKKVDANQAEIVAALRQCGATVQCLHTVGHGCPDLVVGLGGKNYLLEVKNGNGRLTTHESRWHREWRGQVHIVRSVEDALMAVGVIW